MKNTFRIFWKEKNNVLFQEFTHIFGLECNYKTRNKMVEVRLNFLSIVD